MTLRGHHRCPLSAAAALLIYGDLCCTSHRRSHASHSGVRTKTRQSRRHLFGAHGGNSGTEEKAESHNPISPERLQEIRRCALSSQQNLGTSWGREMCVYSQTRWCCLCSLNCSVHWGGGGGGWHDAWLDCCLQPATAICLSPLTTALPLNPFLLDAAAPIGLSPPGAHPLPAWPTLTLQSKQKLPKANITQKKYYPKEIDKKLRLFW